MGLSKIAANALNSNIFKRHINKSIFQPEHLARTLLLTSVSKDVFAYALRVHNAKNNKEMPEDKREYVVKMDATTGVVTALVQVATGFLVSSHKLQNVLTSNLFKSLSDNPEALKSAKAAFSSLSTMFVATLFAKRILVPYISSKIASSNLCEKKDGNV